MVSPVNLFLDSLLLLNISNSPVALSPGWSYHPLGHNSHSCYHSCHPLLVKGYFPQKPGWLHILVWALSGLPSIPVSAEDITFCWVDIIAKLLRAWWSSDLMARSSRGAIAGSWRLAQLTSLRQDLGVPWHWNWVLGRVGRMSQRGSTNMSP